MRVSRFPVSNKCADPGHGRRDDSLRNTPEFLDDETGVESDDPVGPNPARERETALHEIGRIEGDAVIGLGTGGDRQGDEVA